MDGLQVGTDMTLKGKVKGECWTMALDVKHISYYHGSKSYQGNPRPTRMEWLMKTQKESYRV